MVVDSMLVFVTSTEMRRKNVRVESLRDLLPLGDAL